MKENLKKNLKKNASRVLIVVLSAVLCLCTAVPAFAEDVENDGTWGRELMKKSDYFTPKKHADELEKKDPFAFRGGKTQKKLQAAAVNYPEYFDLRNVDTDNDGNGDTSFVTPVKLQNPFGTCWGFAAIAAAESSLISSGLADQSIDLSEKHLSYFVNTYLDDENSTQNGEGTHFKTITKRDEATSEYKYNTGGTTLMATECFAAGMGPVKETDDPDDPVSWLLGYHGKTAERTLWKVPTQYDEDNKPVPESFARKPLWYSDLDDWSMPEEMRFIQDYRLKSSIVLPSPADADQALKYKYSPDAVNAIKQQLCEEHRAVCISFCAESYLPGQDTTNKKYMSDKWAHYTYEQQYSNHSVTIVGWDDNYPAENFLRTPVDEKGNTIKGAFLIKNSWGSELNEFPNNGNRHWGLLEGQDGIPYDSEAQPESHKATGYFWISYADRSLDDPEAFEFTRIEDDDIEYTAQMDLMNPSIIGAESCEGIKSANVFTAEATSKLKGISVFTTKPDTEVKYQIYLLGETYNGPDDGIPVASGETSFTYGGYHRVDLDSPIVLAKGQKYSVIEQHLSPRFGNYICHTMEVKSGKNYYSVGVINPGESFMYFSGRWFDFSKESTQAIIEAVYGNKYDFEFDNFPIKAFLSPITYPDGDENPIFSGYLNIYNWQDGSLGTYYLDPDQIKTFSAEFRGIYKDMPDTWNPAVTWRSTDEKVFTVTPQENDDGRADIKAVGNGSALLVVDAGEYGIRVINIVVGSPEPPKPTDKKANTLTAKGKTVTVKGLTKKNVTAKKHTIAKDNAYTIKNPVGTVTFKKANKSGGKKITVNSKTGKITVKKGTKKGTYKVKVTITAAGNKQYNPGSKTVTVKIKVKK